jgi:hypothetical protein
MSRAAALAIVLALAAPACAPRTTTSPVVAAGETRVVLQACDDGGDGGVLIDGVCL